MTDSPIYQTGVYIASDPVGHS